MAKYQQGFPVNENGEIVVSGTNQAVVGTLPIDMLPVDDGGGLKLGNVALLATDAGGNVNGISGAPTINVNGPIRYSQRVGKNGVFAGATIATQTLVTAVQSAFPGVPAFGGMTVTPQTASASGTLARANFAAPLDWSDVSTMHLPIIVNDTTNAGVKQIYVTIYFDATTANRCSYLVDTVSLVPGQASVIPIALKQPAFIAATRTAVNTSSAAAVVAGGSGYVVGDILQVVGGVGGATTIRVTAVSAGAITAAVVLDAGSYTTVPTNAVSVVPLVGTGTGATFNLTTGATAETARTDGWTTTAGTINWANVYGIAFSIANATTASAGNTYVIGDILADHAEQPAVMLGFDGCYASQWTYVLPILKKYNIQATFYLQQYRIGQSGRMTMDQVAAISAAGHKIALHSFSKDLNTTDTGTFPTAASITAEISGFMTWAAANGLNYIKDHAAIAISSPFEGTVNLTTAANAIAGYQAAGIKTLRMGSDSYNQGRNYARALLKGPVVQTRILKSTTTPAEMDAYLDSAELSGSLASLYGHTCVANSPSGNDFSAYLLDYLCASIARRRSRNTLLPITADIL